uniref:Uncharacterized protein n=1 Tax=Avena sativa TaxID=4498 RepID=A0ACD5Y6E0_AVESA
MVACDFDLSFTYASSGWERSASDAGVLNSAIQSGFRVPEGKYYLVDGGYANTPKFLAPYRNVRYHLKEQARGNCRPRDYKELFNLRHARLRNIIERIIGILKMRFPILKVATHYPIDTQVKIPLVAMVLHNIIRSQRGDEEWLKTQKMHIDPSKYVDVPTGDMTLRDDSTPSESRRKLGNALRDQIAKKMWADYERSYNGTKSKMDISEDPKFRRLQGKEFPLFDALDLLYEGGEEDEDVQRSFDQENSRSGNGGAQSGRARKHRSHTSVPVPRIEETMSEFVKLKREQAGIKEQASGKQYSIPKCLEVLNVMVDVSDEIKILASDVFKDASNRELFLSYDPRLRGCQVQVFRSPCESKSSEVHLSSSLLNDYYW